MDLNSESARHLAYKLRLALGISWNPIVEKIYKIAPPFSMKGAERGDRVKLEAWVRKEELSNANEIFGDGRGFSIGYTCPKLFTVG